MRRPLIHQWVDGRWWVEWPDGSVSYMPVTRETVEELAEAQNALAERVKRAEKDADRLADYIRTRRLALDDEHAESCGCWECNLLAEHDQAVAQRQ